MADHPHISKDLTSSDSNAGREPPLSPHHIFTLELSFPKYDGGEEPLIWLHKCETFFSLQDTPPDKQVLLAAFHMEGKAGVWYYCFKKNHGSTPSWTEFVDAVNKRFGPSIYSNPFGELAALQCTGTVADYIDLFYKHLVRCAGVSEKLQVALFTAGLFNPIQIDVEVRAPSTLHDAMALARAFERRMTLKDGGSGRSAKP